MMESFLLVAGMLRGFYCFLLFLTALFLILLVLIQRGRGGGLAGAFGGMGGQSAFGTKAGDTFTKITIVVATFWIVLCILGVKYGVNESSKFAAGRTDAVLSTPPEGQAEPPMDESDLDTSGEVTQDSSTTTEPTGPGSGATSALSSGDDLASPENSLPSEDNSATPAASQEKAPSP